MTLNCAAAPTRTLRLFTASSASLLEFYCALHSADANKHVEKLFLIASRKQGRRQVQVGYIDAVDSAAAVYFR